MSKVVCDKKDRRPRMPKYMLWLMICVFATLPASFAFQDSMLEGSEFSSIAKILGCIHFTLIGIFFLLYYQIERKLNESSSP